MILVWQLDMQLALHFASMCLSAIMEVRVPGRVL